jgi:hypothetical protein
MFFDLDQVVFIAVSREMVGPNRQKGRFSAVIVKFFAETQSKSYVPTGTGNFDYDQGAMRCGCNDCKVGPGRPPC